MATKAKETYNIKAVYKSNNEIDRKQNCNNALSKLITAQMKQNLKSTAIDNALGKCYNDKSRMPILNTNGKSEVLI